MNYLGHLYLADMDAEHRLGNLMGDWVKGPLDRHALPPRIMAGVRRHRQVDSNSDQHPIMRRARARFSGRHRRVAGIALDVLWDHFLLRHWPVRSEGSLDAFLAGCYRDVLNALPACPDHHTRHRIERIIQEDWIRRYAELSNVIQAISRIGLRLSRDPGLHDIGSQLEQLYPALEQDFLEFPLLPGRDQAIPALTGTDGSLPA
ncbi:acyl carrier protein phosphodiesterase [Natronocella acetinitrilica]|uniref:Acyl carrier protein phosphodiesterase n=1 Tax=Natronocella acetinitrilica TaxID=414046 RepID=A0AAE3KCZ6_9GAMM|nr:ACP phosphodiesterase [Natronocella acetinitrilica]MCP1676264.1 acyl carrier protein phosphodiesterase [Natronocella acetinitrilica]